MPGFNRTSGNGCPCNGCTKETGRYPGCHDHCEDRYIPWRKELDAKNEAERKQNQMKDIMSDAKKKAVWRNRRYSRQVTYNKSTNKD